MGTAKLLSLILLLSAFWLPPQIAAAIIRFDNLIPGQLSSSFDGDGDGINDIRFSTTDPSGFDSVGSGPQQIYIQEPGLAGNSFANPALRVDFLFGAIGSIQFGFALNSSVALPSYSAGLRLYNSNDDLLGSTVVPGVFTNTPLGESSFPEGIVALNFNGVASYGLFTFNSQFDGYIIDNFEGIFGNTEVPEPNTIMGLSIGLAMLMASNGKSLARRRK